MLLLGIIPSPLRLATVATSDVAPAAAVSTSTDQPMPLQVADAGGAGGAVAPVASLAAPGPGTAGLANADGVPPARVPAVAVRAAQASPSASDAAALEPGEVQRLVRRGEEYLMQGDIAAARLLLGRAAEAHDARAAFSLAATYDPTVLKQLRVVGFRPDVAQARSWYEKAAEYGSAEASRRLAALPNLGH
jgi:TPR repeat protein